MDIVNRFETSVISGNSDPNQPDAQPKEDKLVALVTVSGERVVDVRDYAGIGRVTGPGGYSSLVFADLDSVDPENRFTSRTFLYDAPAGSYSIEWEFHHDGDVLPFRTDTFTLPASVHIPAGASEADWEKNAAS